MLIFKPYLSLFCLVSIHTVKNVIQVISTKCFPMVLQLLARVFLAANFQQIFVIFAKMRVIEVVV